MTKRRADHLVDLCHASLAGRDTHSGARATVDVVIDLETLAGHDAPLDRLRSELANGASRPACRAGDLGGRDRSLGADREESGA